MNGEIRRIGPRADMITLRNGYIAERVGFAVTFLSLQQLFKYEPRAFHELVTSCRSREHPLFPGTENVLMELRLVESIDDIGRAHISDHTRNIVLSVVEGDGLEMYLVHPNAT